MGNRVRKKRILRFNNTNPESVYSFRALKNGSKKVETRAASERYREIHKGDTLVFTCGKERFEKKVKKVFMFRSLSDMLRIYRVEDIMPNRSSRKELEHAYHSYPGYRDKIRKFGLIVFEVS